jgi:tRNA A-37 threonylcarbamoyl transferase component Bud32
MRMVKPLSGQREPLTRPPGASPEHREVIQGEVHWQVRPNCEWVLDLVADEEMLQPISVSSGRKVYWREGGPFPLLVKIFESRGVWARVKPLLRHSAASREWVVSREAYRRQAPVPQPLAFGEERGGRLAKRSVLVSEGLEGVPLSDFYWVAPAPEEKRILIAEVGRAIRRVHDAGLLQPDLHAGNLFFCPGKGIFLLDLQRGRLGPPLSVSERLRNLAVLAGSFDGLLSRTDRLRFWQAYAAEQLFRGGERKSLWARLQVLEHRYRRRAWRAKDRRCLRESRMFSVFDGGGFRGFCQRRQMLPGLRELLTAPHSLVDGTGCLVLKDSRTTKVARCRPWPWGPEVFAKRYKYQGVAHGLKGLLRPSRSRQAWIAANALVARGIATARPLAYLERRRFGVLQDSYLITAVAEGVQLQEWSLRFATPGAPFVEKRQLLGEVASLVRRLHDKGVSHRDLKGQNILVQEEGPGRHRAILLDLDGVRFGRVGRGRRSRDLARLAWSFRHHPAVTRADRLRFLFAYLGSSGKPGWKRLWRAVQRAEEDAGWAAYAVPPWPRQSGVVTNPRIPPNPEETAR